MSTRSVRIVVLSVIGLLFVFSLATLTVRSVAGDEFAMYWSAEQTPKVINELYLSPPKENNPPGCPLILHYWGIVFGYGDASLRLFSTLVLILALGALWKVVELLAKHFTNEQRWTIFLLAATTPTVWMAANFARYQALAMLLSLTALYCYLRWIQYDNEETNKNSATPQPRWIVGYALAISLLFYIHYLPAATLALCAGLHYLLTIRGKSMRTVAIWAVAQVAILLVIIPLVAAILSVSSGADVTGGRSKLLAFPVFIVATLYGVMNGAVLLPWWFWASVPTFGVLSILLIKSMNKTVLLNNIGIMLVVMPIVVISAVAAKMYPAQPVFLFPSIQRLSYFAPFVWVFLGMALFRIKQKRLRMALVVVMVACNVFAVTIWNLNIPAVQHTPPLREIAEAIRTITPNAAQTVVLHPIGYGYGKMGVGLIDSTTTTAMHYNLPAYRSYVLNETDIGFIMTADSCKKMIQEAQAAGVTNFWLVQRNRYPTNSRTFGKTLQEAGFALKAEQLLQQQAAFDVWFKTQLLKRGFAGANDKDDLPQQYLYTLRWFSRDGSPTKP